MTQAESARDIPKAYEPHKVEAPLYQMWMDKGYFKPRVDPGREPFCIIMPPPNVTGELHLGHALTATIEDALIRWHRMRGDPTLWLPGVDHAGIATQNVVEKQLAKEGISRHDLGREEFESRVWQWVRQIRSRISMQHMKLGASADWDREVFTLDDGPQRAVRETFVRLYDEGLIYRGERIINWCPRCMTALSDLEVDHVETQGSLWYVRYPLLDESGEPSDEYIEVATTRPETIVGDVAVAVNPEDDRWRSLVGRTALLPIIERHIPIIADEAVETEFGTGAVKVTPGHDPTDFEIGARHSLETVIAMDLEAKMNEHAGPYNGQDRLETRKTIVADLERLGLVSKRVDHTLSIGHCSRCDTIVEPLASTQWFVRTAPLAKPAIEAVQDGRIEIIPRRFERTYMHWMENIRDWCISRQLWWGHRIPVWYCSCGEIAAAVTDPEACPKCGARELEQDPDVLDTWFSSGLWPFSTLGWPDDNADLRYFYPTSVLETGYDILFFWVARMIMLGLYNMKDVPFRHVYLHGLIRDAKGQKMTKSRGNVVDPLEITEKYGTDAVRFTLATGGTPGNDFRLFDEKLEGGRNFANKLWNAARFVIQAIGDEQVPAAPDWTSLASRAGLPLEDRWIISRTHFTARDVNKLLGDFQVNEAGRALYDFIWSEYCDWYVEMAKVRLRDGDRSPLPVLVCVLQESLRLLHPLMPFVTETIWQHLRDCVLGLEEALIAAAYPTGEGEADPEAEEQAGMIMDVVRAIRNIRADRGVDPGRFVEAYVSADGVEPVLEQGRAILETLARVRPLHIVADGKGIPGSGVASAVLSHAQVVIPLAGLIDMDAERSKLEKQLAEAQGEVDRLQRKLGDPQFRSKAPAPVIAKEEEKLAVAESRLHGLQQRLAELRVE
jgi:valyl-tRNA synthetase